MVVVEENSIQIIAKDYIRAHEAIQEAAKLGKTNKFRTQDFPEYEKEFGDILSKFGLAQSKESILKEAVGEQNFEILKHIKQLTSQKGVQARMAYELKIK